MQVFPAKTPEFVKSLFPQFVWHVPVDEKILYLTFDDGPTPEITEWVLQTLDSFNAKATFFCIGENIERHPDIFQNTIESGHAIGNHTHNHLKGWKTDSSEYIENTERAHQLIEKSTDTRLFRPPYGKFKITQAKKLLNLDYEVVLWDVLSYDWDASISPEKCLNNVVTKATSGSIIVMHDSKKASLNLKYALPKILEYFTEKGYRFKALNTKRILE